MVKGHTHSGNEFGMFCNNKVVFPVQVKDIDKSLLQLWKKFKGAAGKQDFLFDLAAAGKCGNYLKRHSMKDRRRNVFPGNLIAQKGLYVRLGEYAASRGNRVY